MDEIEKITKEKLEKLLFEPESPYLDFKEIHHVNKVDLIKDILSLANANTQDDRFIIFGVKDNGTVCGIKNVFKKRKQADVIDILRGASINKTINFKLYTLQYNNMDLDILHIKNTFLPPYFLLKLYQVTRDKEQCSSPQKCKDTSMIVAGSIYERVGDTNAPVANDDRFDEIFRKRFGLDKSPIEKFHLYLKDVDGWKYNENEQGELCFYYESHPEFSIIFKDKNRSFHEPWANRFPDSTTSTSEVLLKYNNSNLKSKVGVWSDGSRILTICPSSYFEEENDGYWAFYYIKCSLTYYLNEMIQNTYHISQSIRFNIFCSEKEAKRELKQDVQRKKKKYNHYTLNNLATRKYVCVNPINSSLRNIISSKRA